MSVAKYNTSEFYDLILKFPQNDESLSLNPYFYWEEVGRKLLECAKVYNCRIMTYGYITPHRIRLLLCGERMSDIAEEVMTYWGTLFQPDNFGLCKYRKTISLCGLGIYSSIDVVDSSCESINEATKICCSFDIVKKLYKEEKWKNRVYKLWMKSKQLINMEGERKKYRKKYLEYLTTVTGVEF